MRRRSVRTLFIAVEQCYGQVAVYASSATPFPDTYNYQLSSAFTTQRNTIDFTVAPNGLYAVGVFAQPFQPNAVDFSVHYLLQYRLYRPSYPTLSTSTVSIFYQSFTSLVIQVPLATSVSPLVYEIYKYAYPPASRADNNVILFTRCGLQRSAVLVDSFSTGSSASTYNRTINPTATSNGQYNNFTFIVLAIAV